ncbi:hypothetical protein [Roseospirillum parvum]|uniref:Uncharacterized protein n=1 Tax=Roseospirillum parvum TaxID=83401 RepID=A0A1G8G6Z6_9PROT|nr:hypothetical protein [Roseospirillum parvum]SDH90051.1 hypothetical protein SAMN05421742_1208 [Roseospirillum parvum]
MLSQTLDALAADLAEGGGETGVVLAPAQAAALCEVLNDCAEQARALEGQPVPVGQRAELPPEVVDLAQLLARRGVRTGRRLRVVEPSGGGDVA